MVQYFYIKDYINIQRDARALIREKNNFKFVAGEKNVFGVHQEKKNISTEACKKK